MESGAPSVTIVIPTYGQAEYLSAAITSALAQDYDQLEVLILDDASPDRTAELVEGFHDTRLRYVRNDINIGRVANYRKGLALAASDFVLNLDGDDWLIEPHYVRNAMRLVVTNPDVAMVFGRATTYDQSRHAIVGPDLNWGLPQICDGTELFLRYGEGSISIAHLTSIYRRDLAMAIGFYQHDILSSDAVSLLQLLPGHQIGFFDEVVAAWRMHSGNSSRTASLDEVISNFAVADVPAAYIARLGLLSPRIAGRWRRQVSARAAHKRLAGMLAAGSWLTALRFVISISLSRPITTAMALYTLSRSGVRKIVP